MGTERCARWTTEQPGTLAKRNYRGDWCCDGQRNRDSPKRSCAMVNHRLHERINDQPFERPDNGALEHPNGWIATESLRPCWGNERAGRLVSMNGESNPHGEAHSCARIAYKTKHQNAPGPMRSAPSRSQPAHSGSLSIASAGRKSILTYFYRGVEHQIAHPNNGKL